MKKHLAEGVYCDIPVSAEELAGAITSGEVTLTGLIIAATPGDADLDALCDMVGAECASSGAAAARIRVLADAARQVSLAEPLSQRPADPVRPFTPAKPVQAPAPPARPAPGLPATLSTLPARRARCQPGDGRKPAEPTGELTGGPARVARRRSFAEASEEMDARLAEAGRAGGAALAKLAEEIGVSVPVLEQRYDRLLEQISREIGGGRND